MQRDFTTIVQELDDGKVYEQLNEGMLEVVRAVMTHGKVGAVTLTLKVGKDGRMATVSADVKTKVPKGKTESTPFFTTEDGELRREDPRQQTLKVVTPKGPTPIRNYKPETPPPAAGTETNEKRE